ncbi:MAG: DsrE/DsrF/DrsH-like family protein [Alicyclobacillus macrosporangiidus]|uniref:DsrE/DsrF/DrsH-like family protein n=1 Tax=Alicyclobacillus macrosporangiidus TaxID=392015 RepID=UPI0026E9DA3C|nr:DsrE/DsrF/DrsH-like family protein [Alicyclobacillus macrosporangiidus]MCL6599788.1 DsrE/DsrF/DrsH-like family protein [Alicyclobacillus macrosporangiidus]
MADKKRRVAIIASQGGLDAAYKVLNIATAAAATDAEVAIFFTFEGLNIIRKDAASTLTMGPGKEHWMEGFKRANVPTIAELLEVAKESGVKFIGCQMTMDVMGLTKDNFIDGVEVGGAVTFLDFAYDADVTVTF